MPSNVSMEKRRRAFNEGRLTAGYEVECPYDNPVRVRLWHLGRELQRAGAINRPLPKREPGQTPSFRPIKGERRSRVEVKVDRSVTFRYQNFGRSRRPGFVGRRYR